MEDQEVMDQFLENKQGYVFDNINAVAGCGSIGVGEVVMGGDDEMMGVKYEEQLLKKNDDDELKYVKEVQQSEKQQLMKNEGDDVSNSNELAKREKETVDYEVGIKEENMYNQKEFGNEVYNKDNRNGHPVALNEHKSKETETEDHFNTVMTNTTNGISHIEHDTHADDENDIVLQFSTTPAEEQTAEPNADQHVKSNDFETAPSQLNPEAKEFVPFFEPNLTSVNFLSGGEELHFEEETIQNDYDDVHVPSALPRNIMEDDDFVAESPRKGRCNDMETISIPGAQEFEKEADQRPQELGEDVEPDIRETNLPSTDKMQQSSLSDIFGVLDGQLDCPTNGSELAAVHGSTIYGNFDADNDVEKTLQAELSQDNELMKQSIYVTSGEGIECVLNSVQPIPTEIDSVNNSFNEELSVSVDSLANQIPTDVSLGNKESLQVEEKEHISKSPSTEEIQTTIQTTSENVADEIDLMVVDNFNNLETAESRVLETKNAENEKPNLIQSVDIQSEHYTAYSTPVEEKYLMENTKELEETPSQTTDINQLMCDMIICDDALRTQNDIKEGESCTMNNVELDINKCEPAMLNLQNTTNNTDEIVEQQHTVIGNYPSDEHLATANDMYENVKHSPYINNARGSNAYEITDNEKIFENATPIVEVITPMVDMSLQLEEPLNAKTDPDYVNKSETSELANEMVLVENAECQQMLGEIPRSNEDNINNIITMLSGENINRDEEKHEPNLIEIIDLTETTVTENHEAVENAISSTVGSAAPIEAAVPLETRNISAGKKPLANKSSVKTLQPKAAPHQIASKKISAPEVAKKPLSAATKTKPVAVKTTTTTTTTASIDRKQSKPSIVTHSTTSTTQTAIRKTASTTTTAPKIPPKGNISARPTQTTLSTAKTTTSKPLVSSRGLGLNPTTARKPLTTVSSSTVKTNPRPVSADPVKPNTLRTSEPSTGKPKPMSPKTTLSNQLSSRKPGQIATTAKSPVKPTVSSITTKTTTTSIGSRPKSGLTTARNVTSVTTKTTTSRAAPKVPSCANTAPRRLAGSGPTGGAVNLNPTTKLSTIRKSSPIKLPSAKTTTKVTTSNTKTVIKSTNLKPTENISNKQLEIIGDSSSNKTTNSNLINSISKTVCVTEECRESIVDITGTEILRSNDNTDKSERNILDTDPLQEDLIGANGN